MSLLKKTTTFPIMLFLKSQKLISTPFRPLARLYSSHKEILFGGAGREALAKGVNILANAVAATLGPKGRNVLIGIF